MPDKQSRPAENGAAEMSNVVGGGQPDDTRPATDSPEQMRGYAVQLATRFGFHVFPVDHPSLPRCRGVKTRDHNPDTCNERGKHPSCKWSEWSTTDVELLITARYFGGNEPRNPAVDCGKSRLLVIDEDAADELARFCADHNTAMPATFTVSTREGRRHYYLRQPDGVELGNREGAFTGYKINIRGHGGYVIAPGARHATGAVYAAIGDCRDIADTPGWVIDAVAGRSRSGQADGDAAGDAGDGKWWRHGAIPEGKRHDGLYAAAGFCRRHGLSRDEAIPTVRDVFHRLDGDKYTWEHALGKLDDAYDRYDSLLDKEVAKERRRRQARRAVDAEEHPPAEFPTFQTLTELLADGIPPTEWRIADMQPAGSRVVAAAQFKAGKTITVANLVRALVDGDPFLDRFPVQPVAGRVALIDFEMSPRQLLAWLRDQGIRNTDAVYPICLRGKGTAFDILTPDGRQRWADGLRQHHVEYVIWDCLRPVADAFGLDEHTGMGPLLVAFDQVLTHAGVDDAAVVHHMGHTGERSRGDSRIRDWPDVEWRLVRQDPNDPASPRYLSAYGRDVDVRESRLEYDEASRRLTMVGGNRQTAQIDDAIRLAVPYVEANPGLSASKIVEALCQGDETPGQNLMRKALRRAVEDGRLHGEPNPRGGHYHYPPSHLHGPSRTLTGEGERDPHTLTYRGEGPSQPPPALKPPAPSQCICPCHRGAGHHDDQPCPFCAKQETAA